MKRIIGFLHGTYRAHDLAYYRGLISGATTIAVDGGYSFFRKARLYPDILIGDFDSLKRIPRDLPDSTEIIRHPSRKDKTDTHLGLDLAVKRGFRQIDLVMPDCGEIDHFLGTVLLLGLDSLSAARPRAVRILSRDYEVRLLHNSSTTITDAANDTVSVVPLSRSVRLNCTGTDYNVSGARLKFGDSRGLRNRITARRATFRLDGKALVIHRLGRKER